MSVQEYNTTDLTVFHFENRKVKDDYTLRKSQRDRKKVRKFLNALLLENDLIIWYNDQGTEKMVIGTLQGVDLDQLLDAPVEIEEYRNRKYLEFYYLQMFDTLSRTPVNIHIDSLVKIILRNDKIERISKEVFAL